MICGNTSLLQVNGLNVCQVFSLVENQLQDQLMVRQLLINN